MWKLLRKMCQPYGFLDTLYVNLVANSAAKPGIWNLQADLHSQDVGLGPGGSGSHQVSSTRGTCIKMVTINVLRTHEENRTFRCLTTTN